METRIKTKTAPLKVKNYLSSGGQLNLTRLTDDACAAFDCIRYNGYGEGNKRRSRGVILRSYREILTAQGWDLKSVYQAMQNLRDIDALNANADE